MSNDVMITLVGFLHNLFTALWIGGMGTMLYAILPALKENLEKKQAMKLANAIKERLSTITYISLVGLIVTGLMMGKESDEYKGLFSFSNDYSTVMTIKHFVVILMVILTLFRSIYLDKLNIEGARKRKLSFLLLLINFTSGVIVLFLSSLSVTIAG